ncbi:universal stress protein [Arthrobacter sp. RHLT1-20]
MVGVDNSRAGHAALEWAVRRASHLHVPLTLVRVVPGRWAFRHASRYLKTMDRAAELLAAETHRVAALDPEVPVTTILRTGETARSLRRLSGDTDMVVVGTDRRPDSHGEGFGSVSFQTATISNCVVAVVPAADDGGRTGVVVGTDGSADAAVAVAWAAAEALRLGQDLTVVHVCNGHDGLGGGADAMAADTCTVLAAAIAGFARDYPVLKVNPVLESGRFPATALISAGAHAVLLVIGCKGRGGMEVLVGSVARDVLMDIQCPTLITRPVRQHRLSSSPQRDGLPGPSARPASLQPPPPDPDGP